MYAPGTINGGKRVTHVVEEVDIAPTILDICNIESDMEIQGTSIQNLYNSIGWHKKASYSEVIRDSKYFFSCLRTDRFKLIWDAGQNQFSLYSMLYDPDEKDDVALENPEIVESLGYGCDDVALDIINDMPDWIPGQQRGKPVPVIFKIPLRFE